MGRISSLVNARVDGSSQPTDAGLIRDVELFCGQEAQHYRQHIRFNKIFQDGRYPKLSEMEKEFAADMKRFLSEKSLAFCLGYSEGFESTGSVFFRAWFEVLPRFRIGARDEVLRMWDWHNAEEFEHREVAFKVYMASCARGGIWKRIKYGYFYRLYMAAFALKHMFAYTMRVQRHMLEIERAKMTPEQVKASEKHFKEMHRAIRKATTPGMLRLLSPFYNPGKISPPKGLDLVLERFLPGGQYGPLKRSAAAGVSKGNI
jgi:predicted metal-dependent hydrolase